MVSIKVENVTKTYKKQKKSIIALDNVNLEFDSGVFTSILGNPGAGKTTLLRLIAGLDTPDHGKIFFDNTDVTDFPPAKRNVSMVFQTYALYPTKTVYDNIASPLKIQKLPKTEVDKKVKETASLLRIDKLLERLPGQLSGGEMQRTAIARSLAKEADIYLFDEPLVNLDFKLREEMRLELKRVAKGMGKTIIYATPDPVDVMTLTDKVAIFESSKMVHFGQVQDVYSHPINIPSATLLGYPPINIMDCSIMRKNGISILEVNPSFIFELDPTITKKASNAGESLILGLRPEYIKLSQAPLKDQISIKGILHVFEIIGGETIVHVKVRDILLKVFVPYIFRMELGSEIYINFSLKSIHIFDKISQRTIV